MSILKQPTTPEPLEPEPDQQRLNNVSLCVWVVMNAAQPCSVSSCGPSQPLNTSIPERLCNRCSSTRSIIVNADRAAVDDPRVTRLQVINSAQNLFHRTDAVGKCVAPTRPSPTTTIPSSAPHRFSADPQLTARVTGTKAESVMILKTACR